MAITAQTIFAIKFATRKKFAFLITVLLGLCICTAYFSLREQGTLSAIKEINRLKSKKIIQKSTISDISQFQHHSDPIVRSEAIKSGAALAYFIGEPCPSFVIDLLEDDDEDVQVTAAANLELFSRFPTNSIAILARSSRNNDLSISLNALPALRKLAKDPVCRDRAISTLRNMFEDRSIRLSLRYNAMIQLRNLQVDSNCTLEFALTTDVVEIQQDLMNFRGTGLTDDRMNSEANQKSLEEISEGIARKFIEIVRAAQRSSPETLAQTVAQIHTEQDQNRIRICDKRLRAIGYALRP
jgi:hypothetical protein